MLKICIFLTGCCASPDICGVLTGRMNEANAALVESKGLMRRDAIMNEAGLKLSGRPTRGCKIDYI
jgi:hypothetical protein